MMDKLEKRRLFDRLTGILVLLVVAFLVYIASNPQFLVDMGVEKTLAGIIGIFVIVILNIISPELREKAARIQEKALVLNEYCKDDLIKDNVPESEEIKE